MTRKHSLKLLGLKQWLENTKAVHNGLGYDEFVERVKADVTKRRIARDFDVTIPTVYAWIRQYQEEKNAGD